MMGKSIFGRDLPRKRSADGSVGFQTDVFDAALQEDSLSALGAGMTDEEEAEYVSGAGFFPDSYYL